jgi:ribosome-binding factor A
VIPELIFYMDEVEEEAQRMDNLISNLHIPKETKAQEEE